MRTLKKVLALSLVFAMAFTMMAGAAFKDQDKIDSSLNDDIQLLTALGVFKGDENGNFNPTDNVRRSEAAKMIYVLKNNGVDDGAVAFQGVSKYSDVPVGHWAEGYINYCTNLGYMGGWQENGVQKFDPNGNVTGVELMKMLLCMIGYKADVQGYTGNGWQTNVLVDAATSGLSVNFTPSVYAATPRQWTARLMTNAINAPYVSYNRGELQFGSAVDSNRSYGQQYLGLDTIEGVLVATNSNKLGSDKTIGSTLNESEEVTIRTGYDTKDQPVYAYINGDADDALLGQPVKAYYKVGTGTNANKLYAVLPYSKDMKVVNTTVDAVKFDSSNDKKVTIEGLGTKTYSNQQISVYWNNVFYGTGTIDQAKDVFLGVNANLNVTIVADKDGYAKTILVHDMVAFAKVDKFDAAKNTMTFKDLSGMRASGKLVAPDGSDLTFDNTSANADNFNKYLNVASDVTEGSVVKIVANTSSGKLVYDITLAEKISGTPSGYTLNSSNNYATVTINGTAYKLAVASVALKNYNWNPNTNTSLLSDTTFYTDGKYVVYSEGGTTTASVDNLAYITATTFSTSWGEKTYKVKALLSDGSTGEYQVAKFYKVDDNKHVEVKGDGLLPYFNGTDGATAKEKVYSYTISDGKITLKELLSDTTVKFQTGVQSYKDSTNTVSVKSGNTYLVDANAYFFVKSTVGSNAPKYSVVKASELSKDQTARDAAVANSFAYKTVNGIDTLLFGTLDLGTSVIASGADYAYANANASYSLIDGKHVVQMVVTSDAGEDVTIQKTYDDQTSANNGVTEWNKFKGKVVTYTLGSDNNVDSIKVVDQINAETTVKADQWNKLVVKGWSSTTAYVKSLSDSNTAEYVNVASDVKIHYVDVTNGDSTSAKLASESDVKTDSTNTSVLAYVQDVNNVKTITDIFVEVDGDDISFITNPVA